MNTVWIVVGVEADYECILGVYSSEEKAFKAVKKHEETEDFMYTCIQEYTIDD